MSQTIVPPSSPVLIKDLGMMYPKETSKQKSRFGIFKCSCGKEYKATINSIKRGASKSCGCYSLKVMSITHKKHGMRSSRLYSIYTNMITRCYNSNIRSYKDYGGRGISVCVQWRDNFLSFYEWAITNGYDKSLEIDRINNNGNYEPLNCRWTTREIQGRNTRVLMSTNTSGYRGVSLVKKSNNWITQIRVNTKLIIIGRFDTALQAAKAYDNYVIENNLEHSINGVK